MPAMRSNIVVGVDGSPASDAAVRWAAREAMIRVAPIKLIKVAGPAPASWGTPRIPPQGRFAGWSPAQFLESNDAQMVVVGSSRRAFGRGMLGPVIAGLLHHANCAVTIVPDPELAQHEIGDAPVLVGIDGSTASEGAAAVAFDQASRRGVPLLALLAWSDVRVSPILGIDLRTYRDKAAELLSERLAGWRECYPDVQVQRRLVCDVPARWLVDESRTAQLVVLGSDGRGGYAGMHLGSVTSTVVRSAHVPVIVVRDGGHETDHKWIQRVWGWT